MPSRIIINEQDSNRCHQGMKFDRSSLGKLAKVHGVDERSLHAWKMALERRGTTRTSAMVPRLVEMIPAAAVRETARYRLRIREVELEVGADFEETSLRRLLGLLKSC